MNEIGSALRAARESRRTTFVEAEQATKIRSKYLQALEEEQFDVLPGDVFAKGFLRTYAEYLDLDGQRMIDAFNIRYAARPDEDEIVLPIQRRNTRRILTARRVVIGMLLLTALVLLVMSAVAETPAPVAEPAAPAADAGADAARDARAGAGPTPREQRQPNAKAAARSKSAAAATGPAPLRVTVGGGESWLEVRSGAKVLFSGLAADGWTRKFKQDTLTVIVGNPAAVTLRRGDKTAHLKVTGPVTFAVGKRDITRA